MTVLDSGFHTVDSAFQVLDLRFFLSESCNPDSNRTGFLELYSGFQSPGFPISQLKSPGFRIPQQKFPGLQNPDSPMWGGMSLARVTPVTTFLSRVFVLVEFQK